MQIGTALLLVNGIKFRFPFLLFFLFFILFILIIIFSLCLSSTRLQFVRRNVLEKKKRIPRKTLS